MYLSTNQRSLPSEAAQVYGYKCNYLGGSLTTQSLRKTASKYFLQGSMTSLTLIKNIDWGKGSLLNGAGNLGFQHTDLTNTSTPGGSRS